MEQKIVRLGVVGLIRGKQAVTDVIGDRNVVIRAIADKNSDVLKKCKEDFASMGVEDLHAYTDIAALLADEEVDAVFIATDKPYHTRHAIMALAAGKHVLSEIPTIGSLAEARELRAAVAAHPELKYMTAENCIFWPFVEKWREMIREGRLGEIVYAEGEYLHAGIPPTALDPAEAGHWRTRLAAIEYLTHSLGPILYMLDDRCVSVTCMEPKENKYRPWRENKELGVALFRTEKGVLIRILICFGACTGMAHNFTLFGTRGTLRTDATAPLAEAHTFATFADTPTSLSAPIEIPVGLWYEGAHGAHGGCDRKMMREFLRCVAEDLPSPLDVDFGIRISLPGVIAHASAAGESACLPIPDEKTL